MNDVVIFALVIGIGFAALMLYSHYREHRAAKRDSSGARR